MKRLGFRDAPQEPLAPPQPRDPHGGLAREDRDAYARLIAHATGTDPRLRPWLDPLQAGRAVVVLTGQQPAMLGGPLYTLYKTWTAIAAARRLRQAGVPAIAAFWCVGDDTDHAEVSGASWPLRSGPPRRVRDEEPAGGSRIGSLDVARMIPAIRQLQQDWPRAVELAGIGPDPTGDPEVRTWSAFLRRSLRLLAGEEPLLFVDGNDPEVQRASQPFLRGFLGLRSRLAREIDEAGRTLRERGETPPVSGAEAMRCLFVADGAGRRVLAEGEDPPPSATLLPNVILRPALQEHLLPVERVVCGEAEIAYRALLPPVYAALGRAPAPLSRRFAATLFPATWARGGDAPDPVETLDRTDRVLEEWGLRMLPATLRGRLAEARARAAEDLQSLAGPLADLDRSLVQVLESAAGKVDFQLRRLDEAVAAKGRAALYRRYPELAHLREFLLPRGKPQERSFHLYTPLLVEGERALRDLDAAVGEWFERGERGHALLALEED